MPQAQTVQQGRQKDSRTAILDAAERAFADLGYGGASIRAIARDADVNQAMVHYYYQNKDLLFSAVVARRADEIHARRNAALDRLGQLAPLGRRWHGGQHALAAAAPLAQGSLHPPQGAQMPAWLTPADASTSADIPTKLVIHFTADVPLNGGKERFA